MKIQLKRSSVADAGVAKKPTPEQMAFGELAVNYSATDPAIFLKNSNSEIVQIAGPSSVSAVPTLDQVTTKGNFSSDGLLIGGTQQTANVTISSDGSAQFGVNKIILSANGAGYFAGGGFLINADGSGKFTGQLHE